MFVLVRSRSTNVACASIPDARGSHSSLLAISCGLCNGLVVSPIASSTCFVSRLCRGILPLALRFPHSPLPFAWGLPILPFTLVFRTLAALEAATETAKEGFCDEAVAAIENRSKTLPKMALGCATMDNSDMRGMALGCETIDSIRRCEECTYL